MTSKMLLCIFLAGCVSTQTLDNAATWEYKSTDRAGYVSVTAHSVNSMVRRAEENFRNNPAFSEFGPHALLFVGAARHLDGRVLIAFSIGGISDVNAVYVFNRRGEIVDKYLHSYW